jgi:type IV pilus assembly protein PilB
VLSTLHTNTAPETVTRLLDMGLEPFNVASALNLILAQRLLRRICSNCKEKYDVTDEELAAAKVKRSTKLKELKFTQITIDNAKRTATPEAAPYLAKLTIESTIADLAFFRGAGCDKCAATGLKGRQGVYEVMAMTPKVRKVVMANAGATEIKDAAIEEGMLTLRMDAWMKVMKGITTVEQMIRETSA